MRRTGQLLEGDRPAPSYGDWDGMATFSRVCVFSVRAALGGNLKVGLPRVQGGTARNGVTKQRPLQNAVGVIVWLPSRRPLIDKRTPSRKGQGSWGVDNPARMELYDSFHLGGGGENDAGEWLDAATC